MSIQCFTRTENNGIHVIFPVEGPMKQNCLLVNDTVQYAFDRVRAGADLAALRQEVLSRAETEYRQALAQWDGADEEARPKAPVPKKVLFDLYRTLLNLRDHGICTYSHHELRSLLPQGTELRGTSQLMPLSAVNKTSEFLKRALSADDGVQVLYSLRALANLPPAYFEPEYVTRRHLGQEEVYFVQLDSRGAVEACVVVAGFAIQPHSLTAVVVAGAHASDAEFRQAVGSHFSRVCGLLSIVTLSALVRFPVPTGDDPDVYLHPVFYDLIGELGFRKSLTLADELGPSRGVVAYDKTLF
jgi:hypothetical protein